MGALFGQSPCKGKLTAESKRNAAFCVYEPAVLDFGKNLGLETDWNCFLPLQDLPEGVSSRLPAGITAIQKHVKGNDDVPLRYPPH